MKYDFETTLDRGAMGSIKWHNMRKKNASIPAGIVPFSAADMEFLPPPELVEGLKDYLDHMIFGYTEATDAYYEAVCGWMERRHGYHIKREWIVESAGVVPALYQLVKAFTAPDDSVVVLSPGYHPFADAARKNGRGLVESLLVINGDTYDIDFGDLEEKLARPEVTLMILCNPHNPVGRVWKREELERICELCAQNGVFLISDEIHCDLILPNYEFTSVANLAPAYMDRCAVCTAPSKTFNLAGFQVSNIIIKNEEYRDKMQRSTGYFSLNLMAYKSCELVYNRCEPWLDELIQVIAANKALVKDFMGKNFPQVHVFELQGTYLQWMDFRGLGLEAGELERRTNESGVIFSQGCGFGGGGAGFERMNLACSTKALEAGLLRLLKHSHLQ